MSTESTQRTVGFGPVDRLALALVSLFTGVTKATVERHTLQRGGDQWTFKVEKAGIQDD